MENKLIEEITRLVVERLAAETMTSQTAEQQPTQGGLIQLLHEQQGQTPLTTKKTENSIKWAPSTVAIKQFEEVFDDKYTNARSKTPARIGVDRAGYRPKTQTWLKFRFDHAAAVDAVYGEVDQQILRKLSLFQVNTKIEDKEMYILRPDLGRRLDDASKKLIAEQCVKKPQVQIIVSNGLSASAINENLENVYLSLIQSLKSLNYTIGTSFYIDQGRVALMDEIGEVLEPEVIVYLIGERPGLVSADSMSAYLCYKPRLGTIESDRMVISNIHKGGIPAVEAGAYLGTVVQRILKHEASGVKLIEKEV